MDRTMKIAIILTAMDKMSGAVGNAVSRTQRRLNSLSTGLNKFGNASLLAGGLGTAFFAGTIKAAEESEVAQNRLQQVFKSMGQDYVNATKQAADYASGLQTQIGFEDETIMAVQAKMATFEKAANAQARLNGVFERATLATFDMQQAGFGDAANNAVQLGKALQDPITGINALRRGGITFTDMEKKKIAQLVKSNQLFKAQNIILKSVEKQVGGVAAKTVTRTQRMRIAWTEVMERIGNGVLPMFTKVANYILEKVIPAVTKFVDEHPKLVKWLAISSAALLGLGIVAKVVAFVLPVLSGALTVLKFAFIFLGNTLTIIGRLFLTNPIILICTAIALIVVLIIKKWKYVLQFFRWLWDGIKRIFKIALKILLWIVAAPVLLIIKYWTQISGFFSRLWSGIKDTVARIWKAIGDAIMAPIVWIKAAWQDFKDWFSNLFKSPARLMNQMIEKAKKAQEMANAWKNSNASNPTFLQAQKIFNLTTVTPRPSVTPTPERGVKIGGAITLNYAPVINAGSGTTGADIGTLIRDHGRDILKQVEEAQRKRDRTKFQ